MLEGNNRPSPNDILTKAGWRKWNKIDSTSTIYRGNERGELRERKWRLRRQSVFDINVKYWC